jgi:hypothetical protein
MIIGRRSSGLDVMVLNMESFTSHKTSNWFPNNLLRLNLIKISLAYVENLLNFSNKLN